MKKIVCLVLLSLILFSCFCGCDVKMRQETGVSLAPVFCDGAVLQRQKAVPVFGTAADGTEVTVEFAGQTKKTVAEDGKFRVDLSEMEACAEGRTMYVRANGKTQQIDNILVGDVWFCSGQSNMSLTISQCDQMGRKELSLVSDNPQVRYLYGASWVESAYANKDFQSAYATPFAYNLQKSLNIPIGVINISSGGSAIEQWLDETFRDLPNFYYTFVQPILPYAVKGILWYQGETNSNPELRGVYLEKFKHYAELYREGFEDENLPIIATQLANCDLADDTFATMRLIQLECRDAVENSYLVCQLDFTRSVGTIHPSNKATIGMRAANIALEKIYNIDGFFGTSAELLTAEKSENKIILTFENVHGTLTRKKYPTGTELTEFAAFDASGNAVEISSAVISSENTVTLTLANAQSVATLSFCNTYIAKTLLLDSFGNPVMPFIYNF